MPTKIKLRRDTKANWEQHNPILADGELGLVKDTGEVRLGDGVKTFTEKSPHFPHLLFEIKPNEDFGDGQWFNIDVDNNSLLDVWISNRSSGNVGYASIFANDVTTSQNFYIFYDYGSPAGWGDNNHNTSWNVFAYITSSNYPHRFCECKIDTYNGLVSGKTCYWITNSSNNGMVSIRYQGVSYHGAINRLNIKVVGTNNHIKIFRR